MDNTNIKTPVKVLLNELKKYIDIQLEYNRVLIRQKSGEVLGQVMSLVIIGLMFLFILLFLSLAFVNWYATHVGDITTGYLIVALFYLFAGLIIFALKQPLIYAPLRKYLVRNISSKEELDFFSGNLKYNPQATKKYLEYLKNENRKQENVLQNQLKDIEEKVNWINITKNVVSSFIQNISTTTMAIKAAYDFGKKLTSGLKRKKKLIKDKE